MLYINPYILNNDSPASRLFKSFLEDELEDAKVKVILNKNGEYRLVLFFKYEDCPKRQAIYLANSPNREELLIWAEMNGIDPKKISNPMR